MMQNTAIVKIYRRARDGQAADETVEFAFTSAAKEYARNAVQDGKAKIAVVENRDGQTLFTFPS